MKILLIEDEIRMADALCGLLQLEGYNVTVCTDGNSGMDAVITKEYDILILDVMLPGMSGYEIARNTREIGKNILILMLTAKSEVDDKVVGLDSGADDYLTKPFETKELLARLRALGRRNGLVSTDILSFGDLRLNTSSCELSNTTNSQSVRLSNKEFRILELFLSNQRLILTREQLALKIWGYENEAEYNNVEVYLSFTRKKLIFIGSSVEIRSLRGVGYELRYGTCSEVQKLKL